MTERPTAGLRHGSRFGLGARPFVASSSPPTRWGAISAASTTPPTSSCRRSPDMAETFWRMATEPDQRSGDYLLWTDTGAQPRPPRRRHPDRRRDLALARRAHRLPAARSRASLAPFVAAISLIPPITILPILFIIFGLGETSKVMLIVLGTAPGDDPVAGAGGDGHPARADHQGRDPRRLRHWQIVFRVVLPADLAAADHRACASAWCRPGSS